jgi:hypothetical protein
MPVYYQWIACSDNEHLTKWPKKNTKENDIFGWRCSGNPVSYLVFIAFIFLIVVVLMNLLNGLAVSDTGLIR